MRAIVITVLVGALAICTAHGMMEVSYAHARLMQVNTYSQPACPAGGCEL